MTQMKLPLVEERPSRSLFAQIAWGISVILAIVCLGAGFVSLHYGTRPGVAAAEVVCGFAIVLVLARAAMRNLRRSGVTPGEEAALEDEEQLEARS
jgi:hypothetical protein